MKRKYSVQEFVKIDEKDYILEKYRNCFTSYGVMFHYLIWNIKYAWKKTVKLLEWTYPDHRIINCNIDNRIFQLVIDD